MNIGMNRRVALGIAVVLFALVVRWAASDVCISSWIFQGVTVQQCPEGRLRQTVSLDAQGLSRESSGFVSVRAQAHGVKGKERLLGQVRRLEASLFLVDAAGKETPLAPKVGWEEVAGFGLGAYFELPQVPDGDYKLRARITTKLGTDSVDSPLPLYTPARIQVLTDRPLYEPGHQVRFRAVVLRARDLAPIDARPGRWFVTDPSGEVMMEQRMPAGAWGVVAGEFPLARGAPTGRWKVRWQSGEDSGEASFQVKPFTLPRFRVEAHSTRPFWRANEAPILEGRVVYSSGAPVGNAALELTWRSTGRWPPPVEWLDEKSRDSLPRKARTDAAGHFRVVLPLVPDDLRGQATLSAWLSATDPAGDQVQGSASVLLAEEEISVSAVTELADGLVDGYSNRVYLRATTADGRVLPETTLNVKRAWDPNDKGVSAVTDVDGVAAFQLDPGLPVTVLVPPMPVRRSPRPPSVSLSEVHDLLTDSQEPSLEDQLGLERWLESLRPCARFVSPEDGSASVMLGVRVTAGGAVGEVASDGSPLTSCLAAVIRTRSLPAGRERMLSLAVDVVDPGLPMLQHEVNEVFGSVTEPLRKAVQAAALDARECLPADLSLAMPLSAALSWRTRPGKREVETGWSSLPARRGTLAASTLTCIQSHFARLGLSEEPVHAMGVVRFTAEPAADESENGRPQDTTMLGYEMRVTAFDGRHELGSAKWVLNQTRLPTRRLRASSVMVQAGSEVVMELLRGLDYSGALPSELTMRAGDEVITAKVERTGRLPLVRFRLPDQFEGWAEVTWADVVTRVYVAPRAELALEVVADKKAYAPGDLAHLQLRTRVDGQEGPAAVGLFGVDESLSQLVTLPGPDALDSLRPVPTLSSSAFGVLDGTALAMGRIRGNNALAATLLRVTDVPRVEVEEKRQSLEAQSPFDADVELTEPFYRVLGELMDQARQWDEKTPKGEVLLPQGMAQLWEKALVACEKRGEPVTDAFGRRLKLSQLPPELLELTDPRLVVMDGARLSEDIENWGAWVAREAP